MSNKSNSQPQFDQRRFLLLLGAMVAIGFTLFNTIAITTVVRNRASLPVLNAAFGTSISVQGQTLPSAYYYYDASGVIQTVPTVQPISAQDQSLLSGENVSGVIQAVPANGAVLDQGSEPAQPPTVQEVR